MPIDTIYGRFSAEARSRLDTAFFYEDTQIRSFRRLAEEIGATRLLDIGANIGLYAVYGGSLDCVAAIDAFEPAPASQALLAENCTLQDHRKITVHNMALSDREDTLEFAIYGELAGNNAVLDTNVSGKAPQRVDRVQAKTLDQLRPETGETFICKIDVEGHELATLAGARRYLSHNRGLLQIETFTRNRAETIRTMDELGYRKIFQLQEDLYFSNLHDAEKSRRLHEILLEEVARSLDDLKRLKIQKRGLYWQIRKTLEGLNEDRDNIVR